MQRLRADANRLGDKGCVELGMALSAPNTLRWCSLRNNEIFSMGAQHLFRSLGDNKTLRVLDLSLNSAKEIKEVVPVKIACRIIY